MSKIKIILIGFLIPISQLIFAQTTVVDSIFTGGMYRSYRLYIPAVFTGLTPRPLILDFHGYTSNATYEQMYSNFAPVADTANFLVVYPQGTFLNGQTYWNAGISNTDVNDVQFILDLIGVLENNYAIDHNKVYSCGLSNGGFMSHTLGCELNNKIAAIASVAGSMFYSQYNNCWTNRAVPVMQIGGTADAIVPYNGTATMLPIDSVIKYWAFKDNCNPTPQIDTVPDINTTDGCTAVHYTFSTGTAGSTCELYKVLGGGHTWPGSPYVLGVTNQDFNASLQMWMFFRKYKLNQFVGIDELGNADDINLYPNPSTNLVNIDGEQIKTISIMDLNGRLLIETKETQIDISSLAKGIYSVIIVSGNNRSVKKLVKF